MAKILELRCPHCSGVFQVPFKQRHRKYCGHSCAILATNPGRFVTADARRTKADRVRGTGKGYVKRNYRHEHRIVAEQMLGRSLRSDEHVHHIDHNPKNNHPSNLEVLSAADHARLHNLGRKRPLVTICKFGHPLVGDNVEITWAGARRCVSCRRRYSREWQREARKRKRANG